ncbi:MAG: RNA polymerase sigma factor [Acidimicrobiia bacterium]
MNDKTKARSTKSERATDRDLVLACRKGDAAAWKAVVTKYERLVFSIPLKYGLSRADAAEITQLTFTILVESLDSLREDSYLGAWMATVAKRHTWRLIAKRRRETLGETDDVGAADHHHGTSDPTAEWDRYLWVHQGLAELGVRCRDLLRSLYLEPDQPSYAEVADALGIAIGSIGPTRARCLEQLKRAMGE